MRYNSRAEVENIGRAGGCLWMDAPYGLAGRFLSTFWLYLEPEDKAFTPHAPDGFWEAWITCWMSKQFDKHDGFLDVGANVGYYSMMAAKAGLWVDAFEPNPHIADMLRKTADLNRLNSWFRVQELALADKPGRLHLNVPEGHSGGGSIGETGQYEVKVDTLDSIYPRKATGRVLIKIDAEGAEPLIWAGMQKYWKQNDVTVILEWDSTRFDCEKFGKALLDGNHVWYVDFAGNEIPLVHWKQLEMLSGLQMIVVRKAQ